jgi:predicted RNase H-like HicB family nuclease
MDFSNFTNVVFKEGDNYVAQSLNVDISSFGSSKKEALANLREALELYFEDADISETPRIVEAELAVV